MGEQLMEKNWIKESTCIFLTKFCHYHWSDDIQNLCMHYQKRFQQYAEEKITFLKSEDFSEGFLDTLIWF